MIWISTNQVESEFNANLLFRIAKLLDVQLGSGLIDQSQKATAAAMQIADK